MILYIVSEMNGSARKKVHAVCKLKSTANRFMNNIGTAICLVEETETIKYEGVEYVTLAVVNLERPSGNDIDKESSISAAMKAIDKQHVLGLSDSEVKAFQRIIDGE